MKEMKNEKDLTKKMVKMISNTRDQELSCDEVHDLLDEYTEKAIAGEDVSSVLPLVHHHLEMCPDCHEEYNALLRILSAQDEAGG